MYESELIKVWDPLVRVFHWMLVVAFFVAYLTEEEFLTLHVWAGYTVLGLILFRVVWGVIGTRHARFSDFVYRPAIIIAYLRDTIALRAKRFLGHNPVGGAMIIAMLISLLLTTLTGVLVYGLEGAGPLAGMVYGAGETWEEVTEEAHEIFANLTLLLIAMHVVGVVVESLLHKENLVRSMITGYKRVRARDA